MLKQHLEAISLCESKDCVLRLQVSVDDATDAVHVVEPQQQLPGDVAHHRKGNASVVILLDKREQVLAQNFERHYVVLSVQRVVEELVEHLQVVRVVAGSLQRRVLVVLAKELLPFWLLEVGSHIEEYFLLFIS